MQTQTTRMPWSVRLAALALAAVALVQAAAVLLVDERARIGAGQALFAAGLVILLVAGIVRGQRLAWLWGRWLGFFLSAALLAGVIAYWGEISPAGLAVLAGGFAAPLLTASLALGRPSAYAWFGLVCPRCGTRTGRGDLLLRTARCPSCGADF